MASYPIPDDEGTRLEALRRYHILDTPPEPAFDRVTVLAAKLFDVPTALIVMVDEHRQWFKSRHGLAVEQTPRSVAFCSHSILHDEVFVVEDSHVDDRFCANPLVTGEPKVRFYAGAPLKTPSGALIGTLALLDRRPRTFDTRARELLEQLARIVIDELELRLEAAGRPPTEPVDARLRLVTEHLPALLWTTDRELNVTSAIGAGIRGASATAVIEQGIDRHRAALGGEPVSYEAKLGRVTVHAQLAPLRDVSASVVGVVGLALDITDRVDAERERDHLRDQVVKSERLASLGALAAGVGHEINNPLMFVTGNLQQAIVDLRAGRVPAAIEALADAEVGAARVQHIARDLKLFARQDDDVGGLADPVAVAESALRMAGPEIRAVATIERDLRPVPAVALEETKLAQVCLNLLLNAAQAIPPGDAAHHRVGIRTAVQNGHVELAISDTGGGISPAVRPHIFEPFYTTKAAGGIGLGLSIVRGIVERAGGTIELDTILGRGTTFRVLLPRAR